MARIIVVDDDENLCNMLVELFRSAGHEVLFAYDPAHLYAQCVDFTPDLVTLDMQTSAGGGPYAKKVIDAADHLKGVKIIFHSNMPVERMKEWFPEAPNHRYVQKGLPLPKLLGLVDEFLKA